jgi:hypothetical protein
MKDGPPEENAGPPLGRRHDRPRFEGPPKPPATPPRKDCPPDCDDPRDRRPDESPEAFHERRTIELIVAVLTPVQQATWKNLIGPPFVQHRRGPPDPPRRLD